MLNANMLMLDSCQHIIQNHFKDRIVCSKIHNNNIIWYLHITNFYIIVH
jgi:hypothetical protein